MRKVFYRVECDGKLFLEDAEAADLMKILGIPYANIQRHADTDILYKGRYRIFRMVPLQPQKKQTVRSQFGAVADEWDRYTAKFRARIAGM